jgi:hypothetical protein
VFQGEIAFRTARVAWYAIDRPAAPAHCPTSH